MTAPTHPVRTGSTMIRTLRIGQHVITAVLVVAGLVRGLTDGAAAVPTVITGVVFSGWYVAGVIASRQRHWPWLATVWMLGLAVSWAVAVVVSLEYVWLAFPLWLLAGHLFRLGSAAVFSVAVFAAVALAPALHAGTFSYAYLVGPFIGGLFAFGISRGYLELMRDARVRESLVASLVQAQTETAELHDELARTQRESGALAERTRLSRDIHDTIAQGFSSIVLLARDGIEAGPGAEAGRRLEQIEGVARASLVDVRRIVAALAPVELEEGALAAALDRMMARLTDETGIAADLQVDSTIPGLPTAVEVALLRTAQSSLANVRQHSTATRVVVHLLDAEDSVRLDIVDDGRGFDVTTWEARGTETSSGYGLRSMRARLRELGGGLEIESAPGEGVALSAHVPYQPTQEV